MAFVSKTLSRALTQGLQWVVSGRYNRSVTGQERTGGKPTAIVFKDVWMRPFSEYPEVPVTKDSENEGLIPSAWRSTLQKIVDAFVRHDYCLADGVAGVAPVSEKVATQIRAYIQDYGATLVSLPQEAWASSVCIWTGNRWDALIDLWTEEEGSSDLVMEAHVSKVGIETLVTVYMVYVR